MYIVVVDLYFACIHVGEQGCTLTVPSLPSAKEILLSLGASRLSRGAFQLYIEGLTEDMTLNKFEEFADYLFTSVKVIQLGTHCVPVHVLYIAKAYMYVSA